MHKLTVLLIVVLNTIYLVKSGEFVWKDGYQYYISYPLKLNWHQAFRFCTYNGMFLIDFHTEQEYRRIVTILTDHRTRLNITRQYEDIWTSGTEIGTEGQYFWETTGHPIQFTEWSQNEPNNWGNIQDCISLYQPNHFRMIDRECNKSQPFVCRDKVILGDTLKNKQNVNDCLAKNMQID